MKALKLFFSLVLIINILGCGSYDSATSILPAESGEGTIAELAATGDIIAIVNPEAKSIFIDEEYQEEFLETFPATTINSQLYFAEFGSDVPFNFRALSEADYSENVLGLGIWMSGRKCIYVANSTCINTMGYGRAKSFKTNGPAYLCISTKDLNSKCLLNRFMPLVQEFYPNKGCKGTPSFERRDDVKVPVCSGAN